MPWVEHEPLTDVDRASLIDGWNQEWEAGRDSYLGIFRGEEVIGGTGLHLRGEDDQLDIGYWIHVDHQGQGYVTEAARALTVAALRHPGVRRVVITHDKANVASSRVPERLLFTRVGESPREIGAAGDSGIQVEWEVTSQLTLSVGLDDLIVGPNDGAGQVTVDSIPARVLGKLYFDSYPPGSADATLEEAVNDIEATFAGAYGELWPEASPVIVVGGQPAAVLLTVHQAPWEDTPDGPFVIEVFTHPDHRRRGFASSLLGRAAEVIMEAGGDGLALRCETANTPAFEMYRSLGFRPVR